MDGRAARLIELACERANLEEFDCDSFEEGLEIATRSIETGPRRTAHGARLLETLFIELLTSRLKISEFQRRNPHFAHEGIPKPIFVFGMPRSGTTLVVQLFAADPAHRALLRWEIQPLMLEAKSLEPMPPATTASMRTDARCQELKRLDQQAALLTNDFRSVHYEAPDEPTECVWPLGHDFNSAMIESLLGSQEYSDWYHAVDKTTAYRYHKRLLQTYHLSSPGAWVLKAPSHALGLQELLTVYPDARLVWCHRDPYKAAGSFLSMILKIQKATVDQPDMRVLLRTYLEQLRQHVVRPLDLQSSCGDDRFHHVFYSRLLQDPIGEMRRLYQSLGDRFGPDAEREMRTWLHANPQGRFGSHHYDLDRFGLTQKELSPYFEDYLDCFEIDREG
jgi:hypothetical protein